jgi:hypothetical protein
MRTIAGTSAAHPISLLVGIMMKTIGPPATGTMTMIAGKTRAVVAVAGRAIRRGMQKQPEKAGTNANPPGGRITGPKKIPAANTGLAMTMMIGVRAAEADGTATPRDMPKRRDGVGRSVSPRAAAAVPKTITITAEMMSVTAMSAGAVRGPMMKVTVDGMEIPRDIRKPPAAAGTNARPPRARIAVTTTMIAVGPGRTTTKATGDGSGIPEAIPKRRGVAGKIAIVDRDCQKPYPWK